MVFSMVSARVFLVGHGPRSASPTIMGSKIVARARKQGATDDLAPGELGLVDDLVQLSQHVVLGVVAGVRHRCR